MHCNILIAINNIRVFAPTYSNDQNSIKYVSQTHSSCRRCNDYWFVAIWNIM